MYYSLGNFNKSCVEGNGEPLINKNVELENIGNLHNAAQEDL